MSERNDHASNSELENEEQQEMHETSGNEEIAPESGYNELGTEELVRLLNERDQKIEELQKQFDEAKNAHLRKAAELENYRKRVQRERTQIFETAKANALEDFLFINDDLHRTLKAAEDLEVDQTFLDGVELVADKFEEVLKKHGVVRIDEEMVPFDVDLHDAMMRQKPEDEGVNSDMVLQIIENGYRIGDRTIRHAKVIVSE